MLRIWPTQYLLIVLFLLLIILSTFLKLLNNIEIYISIQHNPLCDVSDIILLTYIFIGFGYLASEAQI